MNMKKLAILALSLCMIAAVAVTGTIAYFTDTDAKDNVFTFGNVDVELEEVYEEKIVVPGESDKAKTTKEVRVTNHGQTDAWVRVHLAVPAEMVDHNLNSYNNILHINFSKDSVQENLWSWLPTNDVSSKDGYPGWEGNGAENFNHYFTEIDDKEYLVYVVTYKTALSGNATTEQPAMFAYYMDKYTDDLVHLNGDGTATVTYYKPTFAGSREDKNMKADEYMAFKLDVKDIEEALSQTTEKSMIKVIAEAAQVSPDFGNAYDALNTTFGVPGAYCAFGGEVKDPASNLYTTEKLKEFSGENDFAATGYPVEAQE